MLNTILILQFVKYTKIKEITISNHIHSEINKGQINPVSKDIRINHIHTKNNTTELP